MPTQPDQFAEFMYNLGWIPHGRPYPKARCVRWHHVATGNIYLAPTRPADPDRCIREVVMLSPEHQAAH